jgi:hypothetical protein
MAKEQIDDFGTKWFMLATALFYDGVQAILAFFVIGLLINRLITAFAWLHFYTWFKIRDIHVRGREITSSGVAEFIPIIGALPIWTGFVVWMMFIKPRLGRFNNTSLVSK